MFNNGKSINIKEIEDVDKAIEEFSEGNIYLQKLLLKCYSNRIETFACCSGHENDESLPYIAFTYSKENEQFIYYLLCNLKDSNIGFTYNKTSVMNSYFSLEFKTYAYNCFQILNDLIDNYDKTKNYFSELPEDLQYYFNVIKTIEDFNYIKTDNETAQNYFQFVYQKEQDSYNYFSITNNNKCILLLQQSNFKYNNENLFDYYYITSFERTGNNNILRDMNNILDKKVNKLYVSKDMLNKEFSELNIHFEYQDNNRKVNLLKTELGDTIEEISIKLAICKIKGVNAYTIFNDIELNNYNTIDPNEIRNSYKKHKDVVQIKR